MQQNMNPEEQIYQHQLMKSIHKKLFDAIFLRTTFVSCKFLVEIAIDCGFNLFLKCCHM